MVEVNHIIRRVRDNIVYKNRFFTVYDDPVIFPGGREGTYLRVVEPDKGPPVAVIPFCGNKVALVQQYRYAISELQWEIPRGRSQSEDVEVTARAELVEEIGGEPDQLYYLGDITPNSAILDSRVKVFIGHYFKEVSSPEDTEEVSQVRWVHIVDLQKEIAAGLITDSFTLSAVAYAIINGWFE